MPYFKNIDSDERYKDIYFWISKSNTSLNLDNCDKYFRKPDVCSRECYCVPVKDFISFLYEELRDFVRVFNIYLKENREKKIGMSLDYDLCLDSECISILNFNYTDTCEKFYNIKFDDKKSWIKNKAIYIHGKICNDENCNLVFGIQSFDNEKIPVGFNIFKKHHQRH